MRAYIDGKEINEIPELVEVCKMDDWLQGLFDWIKVNRPKTRMDLVVSGDSPGSGQGKVLEVWIGGAPATRAMELGGTLRRLTVEAT